MPSEDRVFIERSVRIGITLVIAVGVLLALMYLLKAALTPLAAALVIAYLFDPLIDRFEASRVKRGVAVMLVVGAIGGGLALLLAVVMPRLITELAVLAQELPNYLERFLDSAIPRFEAVSGARVPTSVSEWVQRLQSGEFKLPLNAIRRVFEQALGFLTGTVSGVVALLVVPILAYYALVEFDELKARALSVVPPRSRDSVAAKARTIDALISSFLRGQLTIALILGILYTVGFSLIGIDLAIGVGLLAGVMALVPYLGNIVAVSAATLLCVLKFGVDVHLALVLGWYFVVQSLEGWYLTPKIMGRSVGLHPALVITALLIGADLLGFIGLLVAVPLAAIVKVFGEEALEAYRASPVYTDETPAPGS